MRFSSVRGSPWKTSSKRHLNALNRLVPTKRPWSRRRKGLSRAGSRKRAASILEIAFLRTRFLWPRSQKKQKSESIDRARVSNRRPRIKSLWKPKQSRKDSAPSEFKKRGETPKQLLLLLGVNRPYQSEEIKLLTNILHTKSLYEK